jgi:Protein of unknown function (DUF3107).
MRAGTAPATQEVIHVEIRIGIANTGRELTFETNEAAADVKKSVAQALDAAATHVSFVDSKGNSYIVPTASLAFVELGTEESRRVGFVG